MTRARGDVIAQENRPVTSNRKALWRLPACIAIAVGILAAHTLSGYLSGLQWLTLSSVSPAVELQRITVLYAWLPRFVIALLAGAALALAGTIFQQVLRNPLAEPLTLGVSAGASLAMTIAAIWAPMGFEIGRAHV